MARTQRLMPDSTFAGAFRVRRLLGQGAMGAVYLADEIATGQPRALKVMSSELLTEPKFAERFAQEARVGATVKSRHVVQVVGSGVDAATGLPWLAMEHLEGKDLGGFLAERGALDRAEARALLAQLFDALSAAHAVSIVHRDLKPENIFVLPDAAHAVLVKVLDFGVAKVVREATLGGTAPGLGTPLWTAPEQAHERAAIKPCADVWALGLLTFLVLTGKIFWLAAGAPGSNAYDLALELVKAPVPAASHRARELGCEDRLPPGFALCVSRDPERRFPTAGAAWAALGPLLSGEREEPSMPPASIEGSPVGESEAAALREPVPRSSSGARLVIVLGVALLVGAMLALITLR